MRGTGYGNNARGGHQSGGYGGGAYSSRGRGGGFQQGARQTGTGGGGGGGGKGINNRGLGISAEMLEFRGSQGGTNTATGQQHHHHHMFPPGGPGAAGSPPSMNGGPHHHHQHHLGGFSSPNPVSPPSSPPPAAAAAAPCPSLGRVIPVPEDRIYSVDDLLSIYQREADNTSACPPGILSVARMLWKGMPEHFDSIGNLRDRLFAEDVAAAPSKVLQDRKLHHEVMGILGKVTEANLDVMRKALTDLPIRQSSKEEIHEVIDVFFTRSTRPEDSRYTPLYVNLIVYLIEKVGKENAGEMIRTEIISQCKQRFFEGESEKAKKSEEAIEAMSQADAEAERMKVAAERKANIFFLGLMFVNGLVTEMIIVHVLDSLLYGFRDRGRSRHPPEADVVLFMELLQTCGPHFSESQVPKLTIYRADIQVLSAEHPKMRAKVLLQNLGETMDNNWVPLHGQNARKGAPVVHSPHSSPAGSPTFLQKSRAVLSASPPPHTLTREDFWKAVDDYFQGNAEDLFSAIRGLPADHVTPYCASALGRYIVTVRYESERTQLGALFTTLVERELIRKEVPKEALMMSVHEAIDDDIISEIPRYFECWTQVISNGESALPFSMHTDMLLALVEKNMDIQLITKFLTCVETFTIAPTDRSVKAAESTPEETRVRTRLHTLPGLLRYTYPMFSGKGLTRDDQEAILGMGANSVEVQVFRSIEEAESSLTSILMNVMKESTMNAYPFLSSFFTYARFNIDVSMEKNRAAMKKLFNWTRVNVVLLLEDVYEQWAQLECEPEVYLTFVLKVKQHLTKHWGETLNQLSANLGKYHHDEAMQRRVLNLESSNHSSSVTSPAPPPAAPARSDEGRMDAFSRRGDEIRKQQRRS